MAKRYYVYGTQNRSWCYDPIDADTFADAWLQVKVRAAAYNYTPMAAEQITGQVSTSDYEKRTKELIQQGKQWPEGFVPPLSTKEESSPLNWYIVVAKHSTDDLYGVWTFRYPSFKQAWELEAKALFDEEKEVYEESGYWVPIGGMKVDAPKSFYTDPDSREAYMSLKASGITWPEGFNPFPPIYGYTSKGMEIMVPPEVNNPIKPDPDRCITAMRAMVESFRH